MVLFMIERGALGRYVTHVAVQQRTAFPRYAASPGKFPGRPDAMLIDGRIIEKLQASACGVTALHVIFSNLQNKMVKQIQME